MCKMQMKLEVWQVLRRVQPFCAVDTKFEGHTHAKKVLGVT